jgi:hypothetical protein
MPVSPMEPQNDRLMPPPEMTSLKEIGAIGVGGMIHRNNPHDWREYSERPSSHCRHHSTNVG